MNIPTDPAFWITTIAVVLGPILAVQAQKYLEGLREKRRRRESVFYALMATRANRISTEHVSALNKIDIEWFGIKIFGIHRRSRIEGEINDSWKIYLDHLNTRTDDSALAAWAAKGDELFVDILYHMSKSLGYNFDKITLKRSVYSPIAHGELELEQQSIRRGMLDWVNGDRSMKVQFIPPNSADKNAG